MSGTIKNEIEEFQRVIQLNTDGPKSIVQERSLKNLQLANQQLQHELERVTRNAQEEKSSLTQYHQAQLKRTQASLAQQVARLQEKAAYAQTQADKFHAQAQTLREKHLASETQHSEELQALEEAHRVELKHSDRALKKAKQERWEKEQEVTTALEKLQQVSIRAEYSDKEIRRLKTELAAREEELYKLQTGHKQEITQDIHEQLAAAKNFEHELKKYQLLCSKLQSENEQLRTERDQLLNVNTELEAQLGDAKRPMLKRKQLPRYDQFQTVQET